MIDLNKYWIYKDAPISYAYIDVLFKDISKSLKHWLCSAWVLTELNLEPILKCKFGDIVGNVVSVLGRTYPFLAIKKADSVVNMINAYKKGNDYSFLAFEKGGFKSEDYINLDNTAMSDDNYLRIKRWLYSNFIFIKNFKIKK